jgi:hypothetical protein
MSLTTEQKAQAYDRDQVRKEKQKIYDKWYMAKARWDLQELKRVVKENELTTRPFPEARP